MSIPRELGRQYLISRGADQTPHLQTFLLQHLEGTCDLLESWGNSPDVRIAGLFHTAYGTIGFTYAMFPIASRSELADVVGPDVERLVYFYGSCDRTFLYPQLTRLAGASRRTLAERVWNLLMASTIHHRMASLAYRDRFDGRQFRPDPVLFQKFLELTFANELEILRRADPLPEASRNYWRDLFRPCLPLLSDGAQRMFDDVLAHSRAA